MLTFSYLFSKLIAKIQIPAIKNSQISKNTYIGEKSIVYDSIINDFSYIGPNTSVVKVRIGKFCSIAGNCIIGMAQHEKNYVSTSPVFFSTKNCLNINFGNYAPRINEFTIIGNDVWIGTHVLIRSGIKIGDGAIVGMGSVVTKDVPPYSIVAGVPARVISLRFNDKSLCERMSSSQWWNLDIKTLKRVSQYINNPILFLNAIDK